MKKKLFIGVLLSVFSFTMLQAAPVNLGSAKKIAREFCDWQSKVAKGDILTCVYPAKVTKSGEFVPYYIFNVGEGNGFVIVSGDDNTMRNVLAYSETGAFDMEKLPDNVRYWLGYYEEQVQQASQMKVPARKKPVESHGTPIVAPLLGDISYSQDAPYNLLCPIDRTTGERSVVGVVATAIVSIAKYYEYPSQGRGTVSFKGGNAGQINADLSQSVYDWSQILPTYEGDGVSSTGKQDSAIALLMRDAGYGASMSYTSSGSGATIYGAVLSAVRHLSYDSLTSARLRDSYDEDAEWISMLKVSLDSAIPLFYTGVSVGGGHVFVCDGYDSMDYFHINWGWGDSGKKNYDGYFLIQVLDPGIGGIGAGSGAYNKNQYVLYNMVPDGSGKCLSDDYRITTIDQIKARGASAGETIEELDVRLTGLYNWTAADFRGKIALALYKDGEFVKLVSGEEWLLLNGVLQNGDIRVQGRTLQMQATAKDLEEGDYEIWVVARSNRENAQWLKVHGSTPRLTDRSCIGVKIEDGKFILRSEGCKLNIEITTTATKTIRYWVLDNYGVELTTGQTTNKKVNVDVLKGVDYTFKFYVTGYDTATIKVNTIQDTSISIRIKETIFTVTALPNDVAMGTVSGGRDYTFGSSATLEAIPNLGYHFVKWDDENTDNPRTLTVTRDTAFTAVFAVSIHTVTAQPNDTAMGKVSGGDTYVFGAEATLTAIPNEGYYFVQWSDENTDNPRTLTVTRDTAFTAVFAVNIYTVTAQPNDTAMGIVTGGGEYKKGEQATLVAIPNKDYYFDLWSDGNTDNPRVLTVSGDTTITAIFAKYGDNPTANEDSEADNFRVYVQDRTIHLSENRGLVQVYNMAGQCVYNGHATAIPISQPGVYVLVSGSQRLKVLVR